MNWNLSGAYCRRVDGVPLAIELSAAWLKTLPCDQIAHELAQSIDFLASSLRNVPERHRSVRAVLEQSWQHLNDEDRRAFRQLAVFVGGFRSEAAEAVAGASLWTLASLVDKSMLQLTQDGRHRTHTLLQRLGAEKLATRPSELAAVQRRHSTYYADFLDARSESIGSLDLQRILAELEEEIDNLRAAWRYAAQHHLWGELGRSYPALFRFLWIRGRYEEGERLATDALTAACQKTLTPIPSSVHTMLRARQAQFIAAQGRQQEAADILAATLAQAEKDEDLAGQALCNYLIGLGHFNASNRDEALASLGQAFELYQSLDDSAGAAQAAMEIVYVNVYLVGAYVTGRHLVEEGLRLAHQSGDLPTIAVAFDKSACIRWKIGDYDGSEAHYDACLEIARKLDHRYLVAAGVGGLGLVAWGRGDFDAGIALLHERLESMQELGYQSEVDTSLFLLCGIFAHAGYATDAARLLATYPDFPSSYFKLQAQIVAGHFAEVGEELPRQTEVALAAENTYDLASYLLAWSMLLLSACPLLRPQAGSAGATSTAGAPLEQDERTAYARRLLTCLGSYEHCRADTRQCAERLLNNLSQGGAPVALAADCSLEELTLEMLALSFG